MTHFHRLGGVAAIGQALTFIIGFYVLATLLQTAGYGSLSVPPENHVRFLIDHKSTIYAWNLTIYVLFGVLLLVQALAVHDRLKDGAPNLMKVATAFGLMWATVIIACGMVANFGVGVVTRLHEIDPEAAGTAWLSLTIVVEGLGGSNEVIGGLWVTLASLAGLKSRGENKFLHMTGLIIGASGLATTLPPLSDLGMVFGLGLILWYLWYGIALIRTQ